MGNPPLSAVFLDRDGVINRNIYYGDSDEWESPRAAKDFVLVPGALAAMAKLQKAGYLIFIVSNQPSYAKGKVSLEQLAEVNAALERALADAAVTVTRTYYCFHHPRGVIADHAIACACRKPSPYFLEVARDAYSVNMRQSWMIGDRDTDIECGYRAGVRTIQVASDHRDAKAGQARPDHKADDLAEAATIILRRDGFHEQNVLTENL